MSSPKASGSREAENTCGTENCQSDMMGVHVRRTEKWSELQFIQSIDDFNLGSSGMGLNFSIISSRTIRCFDQNISWQVQPWLIRCDNNSEKSAMRDSAGRTGSLTGSNIQLSIHHHQNAFVEHLSEQCVAHDSLITILQRSGKQRVSEFTETGVTITNTQKWSWVPLKMLQQNMAV